MTQNEALDSTEQKARLCITYNNCTLCVYSTSTCTQCTHACAHTSMHIIYMYVDVNVYISLVGSNPTRDCFGICFVLR